MAEPRVAVVSESTVRMAINVLWIVLILIMAENTWRHYRGHSSFAACPLCVDPILRRTVAFAEDYCRVHELEADFMSVGGFVYSFVAVNWHIFASLALLGVLVSNRLAAAEEPPQTRSPPVYATKTAS